MRRLVERMESGSLHRKLPAQQNASASEPDEPPVTKAKQAKTKRRGSTLELTARDRCREDSAPKRRGLSRHVPQTIILASDTRGRKERHGYILERQPSNSYLS